MHATLLDIPAPLQASLTPFGGLPNWTPHSWRLSVPLIYNHRSKSCDTSNTVVIRDPSAGNGKTHGNDSNGTKEHHQSNGGELPRKCLSISLEISQTRTQLAWLVFFRGTSGEKAPPKKRAENFREEVLIRFFGDIFKLFVKYILLYGVGVQPAAMQHTMHAPLAALQAKMAAGMPAPPVLTPATPPAAETHATHSVLQPVWQMPYESGPASAGVASTATRARARVRARRVVIWCGTFFVGSCGTTNCNV
jgi:hypothetical protein